MDRDGRTRANSERAELVQFSPFAVVICAWSGSMKHGAIRPHCKHTTQLSGEARPDTVHFARRLQSFGAHSLLAEWSPSMAAHLATPPGS